MPALPSRDTPAIEELAVRLGHSFANIAWLQRAVTHSSHAYEEAQNSAHPVMLSADAQPDRGNEQMEFLGDAVLGLVAAEWLYRNHPSDDEGRLTRLRAALVSRKNLCRIGKQLGLGAYLRLGKGEERSGGRAKSALLADAVEAVIAAVYLDAGLAAATALVEREILQAPADGADDTLREIEDWKSALQEWAQARGEERVSYTLASTEGADHAKRFTVELRFKDEPLAQATASSKKQAEQWCARAALDKLRARAEL